MKNLSARVSHKRKGFGLKDVLYIALFYTIVISTGYHFQHVVSENKPHIQVAHAQAPTPTSTPVPPTPTIIEYQGSHLDIFQDIKNVFGKYSDNALLLLMGNGVGGCHENGNLDPNITHTNDDGSVDWGVFQLNDNWNGFKRYVRNQELLTDPTINIRIAYRIFVNNNYSFSLWTCGKYYGI